MTISSNHTKFVAIIYGVCIMSKSIRNVILSSFIFSAISFPSLATEGRQVDMRHQVAKPRGFAVLCNDVSEIDRHIAELIESFHEDVDEKADILGVVERIDAWGSVTHFSLKREELISELVKKIQSQPCTAALNANREQTRKYLSAFEILLRIISHNLYTINTTPATLIKSRDAEFHRTVIGWIKKAEPYQLCTFSSEGTNAVLETHGDLRPHISRGDISILYGDVSQRVPRWARMACTEFLLDRENLSSEKFIAFAHLLGYTLRSAITTQNAFVAYENAEEKFALLAGQFNKTMERLGLDGDDLLDTHLDPHEMFRQILTTTGNPTLSDIVDMLFYDIIQKRGVDAIRRSCTTMTNSLGITEMNPETTQDFNRMDALRASFLGEAPGVLRVFNIAPLLTNPYAALTRDDPNAECTPEEFRHTLEELINTRPLDNTRDNDLSLLRCFTVRDIPTGTSREARTAILREEIMGAWGVRPHFDIDIPRDRSRAEMNAAVQLLMTTHESPLFVFCQQIGGRCADGSTLWANEFLSAHNPTRDHGCLPFFSRLGEIFTTQAKKLTDTLMLISTAQDDYEIQTTLPLVLGNMLCRFTYTNPHYILYPPSVYAIRDTRNGRLISPENIMLAFLTGEIEGHIFGRPIFCAGTLIKAAREDPELHNQAKIYMESTDWYIRGNTAYKSNFLHNGILTNRGWLLVLFYLGCITMEEDTISELMHPERLDDVELEFLLNRESMIAHQHLLRVCQSSLRRQLPDMR